MQLRIQLDCYMRDWRPDKSDDSKSRRSAIVLTMTNNEFGAQCQTPTSGSWHI